MTYVIADPCERPILDRERLAADLAPLLGATLVPLAADDMASPQYRPVELAIGNLRLGFRAANYGKDPSRCEVDAYAAREMRQAVSHGGEKFPSCTFDSGRPLATLAAQLKRVLVEPSAAPLASVEGAVALKRRQRAAIEALVAEWGARFPQASITLKDAPAVDALFYLNAAGVYLSGRLNSDGSLYPDRLGTLDPATATRVIGALLNA